MTLVLMAFCDTHVAQVSDRLITDLATRAVLDCQTKAVAHENRFIYGYTGLAELEGLPTDIWLAKILSSFPKDALLSEIAAEISRSAEDAIAKSKAPEGHRRLMIVGSGWAARGDVMSELEPAVIVVENFFDDAGQMLDAARRKFRPWFQIMGMNAGWMPFGVPLTRKERMNMNLKFQKCSLRRMGGLKSLTDLFVGSIRGVATRCKTVGRDVLVTILSKAAAESESVTFVDPNGASLKYSREGFSLDFHENLYRPENLPWLEKAIAFKYLPDDPNDVMLVTPTVALKEFGVYGSIEMAFGDETVAKQAQVVDRRLKRACGKHWR